MKFIVLLGVAIVAIPASALAGPTVTIVEGFKSENQRPNGGVLISRDPIWAQNIQITDSSGVYVRLWSTAGARKDTELRPGIGVTRPCLGGLTCRAEVGYWATPDIAKTEGDVIALSSELSGKHDLGPGESVGFSAQAEYLAVRKRPDTQILRGDINYTRSIGGVPVRIQFGLARNVHPGWMHLLPSLSANIKLSQHVSFVPSIEGLHPLNDRAKRHDSFAFGFTFIGKWKPR